MKVIYRKRIIVHRRLQPMQEQHPRLIQFHGMLTLQCPTILIAIVIETGLVSVHAGNDP
jgi:hypothetical protein